MSHIEMFRALTPREREVLDLFCQGLPYREIGERLFISVKGVKTHMQHIYQKLGLMHLPPKARAFTLREEYWPLVKSEPQPAQEEPAEPEIIEPIPAEIEELIDADEATMTALVVAEPITFTQPPKPARPRRRSRLRSCLAWLVILFVIAAGTVWYLGGLGILGNAFSQLFSTPTPDQEAIALAVAATNFALSSQAQIQSATSTPELAPSATQTATNTLEPTLTLTPTPWPSPTYNFGPIYEMGAWHKQGDLWFRVFEWGLKYDGIYVLVEMWNQTNQDQYFRWDPTQNGFLQDNHGVKYTLDSGFDYGPFDEVVSSGEKRFVTYGIYTDVTFVFESQELFSPGVTDLFFTLEYFSDRERATWHISVGG